MTNRLLGLDFIRAYAAIAVLLHHIWTIPPSLTHKELPFSIVQFFIPHGYDAVNLFFVLSGFLITFLLLSEGQRRPVSVKRFYLRLVLRIWPLYYSIVFVTWLVAHSTPYLPPPNPAIWGMLLFFGANIASSLVSLGLLDHLWSIGVEEQFYLAWPWLKLNRASTYIIIILACKIAPVILFFVGAPVITSVMRFESMAIGGLGAWLLFRKHAFLKILYLRQVWGVALALFLIDLVFPFRDIIPEPVLYTLESVLHAVLIVNAASNPACFLHFESKWTRLLGDMSYSIYMLHPLVIYIAMQMVGDVTGPLFYLVCVVGTLLAAVASYRFLEQPFLRLKSRFGGTPTHVTSPTQPVPTR